MGEATAIAMKSTALTMISIHASRGGSDRYRYEIYSFDYDFNPRFPWGKRLAKLPIVLPAVLFQSTLPVGEATPSPHQVGAGKELFQSTLPVGEATPIPSTFSCGRIHFNPRFPWGKRPSGVESRRTSESFQSTLPVGEAT